LLLFLAYGFASQDIQLDFWAEEELFNARTFPVLIAIGGCMLALLYIVFAPALETPDLAGFNIELIGLVVLMLLYAGFLEQLGFVLATGLFLCAGFLILGERRPARLGLVTVTLTGGFYFLMAMLEIQLPQGLWIAEWTGEGTGSWEGVLEGIL
jgi:putative tricarboxylic transport membrane protein